MLRHKRRCHTDEFQEPEATAAANVLLSASHDQRGSHSRDEQNGTAEGSKASAHSKSARGQGPASRKRKRAPSPEHDLNVDPSLRGKTEYEKSLHDAATAIAGKVNAHQSGDQDHLFGDSTMMHQIDPVIGQSTGTEEYGNHSSGGGFGEDTRQPFNEFPGLPLANDSWMRSTDSGSEKPFEPNTMAPEDPSLQATASDQHGIEHAAALLSMAYAMHKEQNPLEANGHEEPQQSSQSTSPPMQDFQPRHRDPDGDPIRQVASWDPSNAQQSGLEEFAQRCNISELPRSKMSRVASGQHQNPIHHGSHPDLVPGSLNTVAHHTSIPHHSVQGRDLTGVPMDHYMGPPPGLGNGGRSSIHSSHATGEPPVWVS